MYPYVTSASDPNLKQSIEEIWVNSNLQGRIQWAKNSDGSPAATPGTVVNIPPTLKVANTYVIYSTISYLYIPTGGIGYVINKAGVLLSDFAYTRPRVSQCVLYAPRRLHHRHARKPRWPCKYGEEQLNDIAYDLQMFEGANCPMVST